VQPRQALRVSGEQFGKNLQRNLATQLRVARFVHLAHAAGAKQRVDDIRPELCSRAEGHGMDGL
jgi:hypothetical protein